jgi:hypothetical protein
MSELLKINVNEHTERKGQLTYLSWAWAWAEVLKIDPKATWKIACFGPEDKRVPYMAIGDTAMVITEVAINGLERGCQLPVMDNRNKAIKNPDAFAINTAIMRCLAKAIAMHGLGLYIYAGEDLPEGEEPPEKEQPIVGHVHAPAKIIWDDIQPERQDFLRKVAKQVTGVMPDAAKALDIIDMADLEGEEERGGLWYLLDSKARSALRRASEQRQQPQPPVAPFSERWGTAEQQLAAEQHGAAA